jgi:hypothetical protein
VQRPQVHPVGITVLVRQTALWIEVEKTQTYYTIRPQPAGDIIRIIFQKDSGINFRHYTSFQDIRTEIEVTVKTGILIAALFFNIGIEGLLHCHNCRKT